MQGLGLGDGGLMPCVWFVFFQVDLYLFRYRLWGVFPPFSLLAMP